MTAIWTACSTFSLCAPLDDRRVSASRRAVDNSILTGHTTMGELGSCRGLHAVIRRPGRLVMAITGDRSWWWLAGPSPAHGLGCCKFNRMQQKGKAVFLPPVRMPMIITARTTTNISMASSLRLRSEHRHLCCFISSLCSVFCRVILLSFCLSREQQLMCYHQ
ncbi:hypothetical protein U9M48_020518, partial [Paspalum notatum var. saurae]